MGFIESIRTVLMRKYATFSGRASRSEYWWFQLFSFLMILMLTALATLSGILLQSSDRSVDFSASSPYMPAVVLALFLFFATALPQLALHVRRFHDRNLSGWWYFALLVFFFIPYVGFIFAIVNLVITILKGTEGLNVFGPDPLQPGSSAAGIE